MENKQVDPRTKPNCPNCGVPMRYGTYSLPNGKRYERNMCEMCGNVFNTREVGA